MAGIQLLFDNALQNQFNQIKAIRSFILNGVDVIAFSPIVEDGWDNILLEAKAAGIPVILVDRYIKTEEEGLYCAFIGSDFYKEGVMAGEWMVERFAEREGPVKVAEIKGTENSSPTIGRYEGLRAAFHASSTTELFEFPSKFEIVISVSGDFMRSKGRECMETILEQHPDIDILYAHNDDMALGAIETLEKHGIKPGEDIIIVSVDAQKSGLEALKQGKINCLVECNPYIGNQLMDLVLKIKDGKPFPEQTFVEEKIFTDMDDFSALPVRL
jgi:simple sugar transport system substrate-binding protein